MASLRDIDPVSVEDDVVGFMGADRIAVGTQPSRPTVNTGVLWMRTAWETSVR
jgi:hypothetical protein